MKRHYLRYWPLLLVCLIALVLTCCSRNSWFYEPFKSDLEKSLDSSRLENATLLPDFTGDISDIRVTSVLRDVDVPLKMNSVGINMVNREYRQMCYGYCVDGNWVDLPSENYDLVSIFNLVDYNTRELVVYRGIEAIRKDHMVKIGPYLLISILWGENEHGEIIVEDTLGSNAELVFQEYDNNGKQDLTKQYGQIYEERDTIIRGWDLNAKLASNFDSRYILVLEYDQIPEDYKLWRYYENEPDKVFGRLTYSDIKSLIEGDE